MLASDLSQQLAGPELRAAKLQENMQADRPSEVLLRDSFLATNIPYSGPASEIPPCPNEFVNSGLNSGGKNPKERGPMLPTRGMGAQARQVETRKGTEGSQELPLKKTWVYEGGWCTVVL